MIEKFLNKLGLYTKEQYLEVKAKKEKVESDYENVIAALKVCEDEKRVILAENNNLKTAYENRKKQIDLLLSDFEKLEDEKEEFKKEIEKLRLKIARSVKRRKK